MSFWEIDGSQLSNLIGTKPTDEFETHRVSPEHLPTQGKTGDIIHRMLKYPSKIWYRTWMPFIKSFSNKNDIILDPMCGSGTTGLAALMLNRKTILMDASSYSVFLAKSYLSQVNFNQLNHFFNLVSAEVMNKIHALYVTHCAKCGGDGIADKITVSNIYECANCKNEINLANSRTGKRSVYKCNSCDSEINIATNAAREQLIEKRRPVAVRIKCPTCGFHERPVTTNDLTRWNNQVQNNWTKSKHLWVPTEQLPHQRSYPRVGGWPGIEPNSKISELFSDRNLLALAFLRESIIKLPKATEQQILLFILTEILSGCSKRQHIGGGPFNVFYIIPSVGLEKNVYTAFERKYNVIFKGKQALQEQINTSSNNLAIFRNDSRSIPMPTNSIDYVCFDPPYGGYVPYFELNVFHSAWLGETEYYDEEVMIPMDSEKSGGVEKWGLQMAPILYEVHRVLRPKRYMTIAFQSRFPQMWNEINRVVSDAGFMFHSFLDIKSGETFHTNLGHAANPKRGFATYSNYGFNNNTQSLDSRNFVNDLRVVLQRIGFQNGKLSSSELVNEFVAFYHEMGITVTPSLKTIEETLKQIGFVKDGPLTYRFKKE